MQILCFTCHSDDGIGRDKGLKNPLVAIPCRFEFGIDKTSFLEITTPDGESLLLTPVEKHKEEKFKKALSKVNKKYSKSLKKLAE